MIYTLTLNPALDYVVQVPNLQLGTINRTSSQDIYPGGKGCNVSIILSTLGYTNTALGFIGGFTGQELKKSLLNKNCNVDFIEVKEGNTRINVKIKSQEETEINGEGPIISKIDITNLIKKLKEIKPNDYLILSGSIPNSLPDNIYTKLIQEIDPKVNLILDISSKDLLNLLKYQPFLIKPNDHELSNLFNVKINKDNINHYMKELKKLGAKNVLISLGSKGAILLDQNNVITSIKPHIGTVINSVGAGDSMVAGFLAGYLKNNNFQEALLLGNAAGAASAFTSYLATKKDIENLITIDKKPTN